MTLQRRLKRCFSMFSLIPVILLCSVLLVYISANAWQDSRGELTSRLDYAGERLESLLREAYQIGNTIAADEPTIRELDRSFDTQADRYLAELKMGSELTYILRYFSSNVQLYVLAENGACCKSGRLSFLRDDYRGEAWYQSILAGDEAVWFPMSDKSRVVRSMSGLYVSMGLPIRIKGDTRALGVVLVETRIDDAMSDLLEEWEGFYIMDTDLEMTIVGDTVEQYENEKVMTVDGGTVQVYNHGEERPDFVDTTIGSIAYWKTGFKSEDFFSAGRYALGYTVLPTNNWILVGCIPFEKLYHESRMIMLACISMITLLSLIAVASSHRVAYTVTQPIMRLNESVHKVSHENFDVVIDKLGDDEIGELSVEFNRMVRHIKALMDRIIEEQTNRRKYELMLLQAQINPHFLYNTLDSIVWLVRMKKNEDAEIMLNALTTFFKTGLNRGSDVIQLSEEFNNVQSYMTIQTYRYKTHLSYRAEIDEHLGDMLVPKLILQPLVENAIYHGIKEKEQPGCIIMRCCLEGTQAVIQVEDDGLGMSPERLSSLRSQIERHEVDRQGSYGILNVCERLRLFFRDACSVQVESEADVGTRVTIYIDRR